ncbi:ABTB2 [Cordylochernes scorpioides]|uniref:ABTB2 n=1 Tax=Cordylochernes scorpioides TaxID=51811 RepID=A0ABY6LAE3_9ARAC|nr:ABTB2 [Cordylochernes scorpioides]
MWPMVIFYSLLNIGAINSQIIHFANGNASKVKSRRHFLKTLSLDLIEEMVKVRTVSGRMPCEIKEKASDIFNLLKPGPSKKPKIGERHRCKKCQKEKKDRNLFNIASTVLLFLVMEYLYKGGCEDFLQLEQNDVLELMAAADFFQLDGLTRLCEVQCSRMLDADNAVSMYIHAQVYGATHLLEYCRGFLLQHLVALLSYDDSLRRLLFGKRLLNHDVLSGLLLTLQARHRERGRPSRNSNGV